jgi:hypothetical protein
MNPAKPASSRDTPRTIGAGEVEGGRVAGEVAEDRGTARHPGARKGALAMLVALIAAALVFDIFWWLRR